MVLALFRSAYQFDGSVIVYFLEKKELRQKQSLTGKAKLKPENIKLCLSIHKPLVEKQAGLTCLTTMITMCPTSGLGTKPIVGFFLHLGQLLSTCVPFSLGASEGGRN